MKNSIVFVFLLCLFSVKATENKIILLWTDAVIQTTKNTVGYTPPVASRAYAYYGLTLYYAANADDSVVVQKLNQIHFSEKTKFDVIDFNCNKNAIVNAAAFYFVRYFYKNADSNTLQKITALKASIEKKFSKKEIKAADNIGKAIAEKIFFASTKDGGHEGYMKNYPTDFVSINCEGCWVRTPPSFFPALLPYWGNNQMLLPHNFSIIDTLKPMLFSIDSNAEIFKESLEMYSFYKHISKDDIATARYWNDDPGYSGTPSGHILSITIQMIKQKNISLEKATTILAAVGVALNDVNIITWRLKFSYNYIRPITYIHRYIGKDFSPAIPTPPFPEFPSGHSCLSGAGITVLQNYFITEKNIIDNTHENRVDIDGHPRKYTDFEMMKNELSNSRWLGGIHFKNTLDKSVQIGNEIGLQTFLFFNL